MEWNVMELKVLFHSPGCPVKRAMTTTPYFQPWPRLCGGAVRTPRMELPRQLFHYQSSTFQGHLCQFSHHTRRLKSEHHKTSSSKVILASDTLVACPIRYTSYCIVTAFRANSLVKLWLHLIHWLTITVILSNHWVIPSSPTRQVLYLYFCVYFIIYDIYRPHQEINPVELFPSVFCTYGYPSTHWWISPSSPKAVYTSPRRVTGLIWRQNT